MPTEQARAEHPGLAPVNDAALTRESWKIFQVMAEFVEGFERLARIRPSVSVFGSARFGPDDPYYKLAQETSRQLSDAGFAVVTGRNVWSGRRCTEKGRGKPPCTGDRNTIDGRNIRFLTRYLEWKKDP